MSGEEQPGEETLPVGTVKLDAEQIRVERFADGHVLIGDDSENVVLSPDGAQKVFALLGKLLHPGRGGVR
jgi:hypothetical protein